MPWISILFSIQMLLKAKYLRWINKLQEFSQVKRDKSQLSLVPLLHYY